MLQSAPPRLVALIEPVVAGLGYELVGIEFVQSKSSVLRVYIDQEAGIQIEDCEKVSHQLSAMLDVEDPIDGNYHLEVSSPGLDRPLMKEEDFERFAGQAVRIEMAVPVNGQRRFKGVLEGLVDGSIKLAVDGQVVELPLSGVGKARLIPQW